MKEELLNKIQSTLTKIDWLVYFGSTNYKDSQPVLEKFDAFLKELNDGKIPIEGSVDLATLFKKTSRIQWTTNEISYIETFIASRYGRQRESDRWLLSCLTAVLANIPDPTMREIYRFGIKSMVFGIGNCELKADLFFIEFIRALSPDIKTVPDHALRMLHLIPKDSNGDPLEELFCVAIGDWPKKGAYLVIPWLRNQRVFEWQGSFEETSDLMMVLEELNERPLDVNHSLFYSKHSLNAFEVWNLSRLVRDNHHKWEPLRDQTIKTIRNLYCQFLSKFTDTSAEVIAALEKGKEGPYAIKFEFGLFKKCNEIEQKEDFANEVSGCTLTT